MTDNEIVKALQLCFTLGRCEDCPLYADGLFSQSRNACRAKLMGDSLALINRQKAEIERLQKYNTDVAHKHYCDGIKEFAEKINELLGRYAHLHKYADDARHSAEEYLDGTPMEMVSVWEVLSLKKWEMVDYETMNELQENIETIAKERLLSELEKDFHLLIREMMEGEK